MIYLIRRFFSLIPDHVRVCKPIHLDIASDSRLNINVTFRFMHNKGVCNGITPEEHYAVN